MFTPTTLPNKNLYNGGSEWQNDYGNLPDYYQTFNRNYDSAIARFVGVDPVAESAESITSYQYAGDNPIMNNDPEGNMNQSEAPSSAQPASHFLGYIAGQGGGGTYSALYGPSGGSGYVSMSEWENEEMDPDYQQYLNDLASSDPAISGPARAIRDAAGQTAGATPFGLSAAVYSQYQYVVQNGGSNVTVSRSSTGGVALSYQTAVPYFDPEFGMYSENIISHSVTTGANQGGLEQDLRTPGSLRMVGIKHLGTVIS